MKQLQTGLNGYNEYHYQSGERRKIMRHVLGYPILTLLGFVRDTEVAQIESQAVERVVVIEQEPTNRARLRARQSNPYTKIISGKFPINMGLNQDELVTMAALKSRINVLLLDGDWTFPTSKSALKNSFEKFEAVLGDVVRIVISFQSGRAQKDIGLEVPFQEWKNILMKYGTTVLIEKGMAPPQHWAIFDVRRR